MMTGASGTLALTAPTLTNNNTISETAGGAVNLTATTLNNTANSVISGGGSISVTTFTNSGTIIASNSGTFTVNATTFTNTGTVKANSNSTINFAIASAGSLAQSGGVTQVDGTLTSNTTLQLQGGDLVGTGTVNGNVNNTGGIVRPGDLLGTLTVSGNYTQTSTGKTEIDLGGTQQGVTYDLLKVTSLATLGGQLDVKLANGFTPTIGEQFDFLSYGSRTEQYDSVLALDPGYSYTATYNDTSHLGILTVAAVPESSTLFSAGLMLGAGALLLSRRKRSQPAQQQAA